MRSLCCLSVYPLCLVIYLSVPLALEVFEAYEITLLSVCVSQPPPQFLLGGL
jgi:hypothetical protein